MAARAEGCIRIRIVTAIWGLPCGGLDAGSLRGEGLNQGAISHPASDTVLWASASVTGRLRAEVWKPLFLELDASLVFPFQHQRFVFEQPSYQIYEVPWVGRRLEAGLGVHFL
jgi:hypothetical protein